MYSSSYSQAKFGLEAREPLHKPKGKSCGYYMRIVFFFSSLIQSLIIVSLVLFLIYGQPEKSAERKRVEELELNFNRLSDNNIQLRKEKGVLGAQLGTRTAEKAALEAELVKLKTNANNTENMLKARLAICERKSATLGPVMRCPTPIQPVTVASSREMELLKSLSARQKAMIHLTEVNFTQTVLYLRHERDKAVKDRDTHHQDAITLRRENAMLQEQLTIYTRKCKEDFAHSLEGIKTVTKEFLNRINNLFPDFQTFHITCDRQLLQIEMMKNSCTNLSRDVENKFQLYLDKVGKKVAEIQALSSRLEVQKSHLTSDLQQCERSRSEAVAEAAKQLQLKQSTHDNQVEKLLIELNRLREQKKLQEDCLALRVEDAQAVANSSGASGTSKTPKV